MKLFKKKCFLVNLWREIYQFCLIWLYITQYIYIYIYIYMFIILIKVLLGNKLNDFCLKTLYFLVFKYFLFSSLFQFKWRIWNIFFNWGSSFWLTLFSGCSLEFLSIIIMHAVSWGAVFDLEIPSWLLLDTKLVPFFLHFVFHFWFLVIVLLGSLIDTECPGYYFWEKLSISFWTFDKLVSFSIFPCYLDL